MPIKWEQPDHKRGKKPSHEHMHLVHVNFSSIMRLKHFLNKLEKLSELNTLYLI